MTKLRAVLFWHAVAVSPLPFVFGTVSWDGRQGVHWLWVDHPEGAILCAVGAVFLWIAYAGVRHRHRLAGSESAGR